MNSLSTAFALPLLIILETNQSSQTLISEIFTPKTLSRLICLQHIFNIRKTMHKYSDIYSFLCVFYHISHTFLAQKYFYTPNLEMEDYFPTIIIFIIVLPLTMLSEKEIFPKIEASPFISNLIISFFNFINVYFHFGVLDKFHLRSGLSNLNGLEFRDKLITGDILYFYILGYIIYCSGCFTAINTTLIFKDGFSNKYIYRIIRRCIYFASVIICFLTIYNQDFASKMWGIYDIVSQNINNKIITPSMSYILNLLPVDKNTKLKVLMHILINLINF